MLALLRVAPLLPSPTLRAVPWRCQVGTGKQAHRSNWKAEFGCHRPGRATPRSQPLMYFFSGRRCSFSPALTPGTSPRSIADPRTSFTCEKSVMPRSSHWYTMLAAPAQSQPLIPLFMTVLSTRRGGQLAYLLLQLIEIERFVM